MPHILFFNTWVVFTSKLCPIPLCTSTVFLSVKDITWLLNSFGSLWRPWKNLVYHKLVHKIFFLVCWLISYIIILSNGIKWHQSSLTFSAVWVDILSDLSFDGRIRLLSGLCGCDLTHHHDQAVDKNNTEGHIPHTNVNYINLCLLCYDWPENSVTAATVYWSLLRLYLLWMIGFLLGQRAFIITESN